MEYWLRKTMERKYTRPDSIITTPPDMVRATTNLITASFGDGSLQCCLRETDDILFSDGQRAILGRYDVTCAGGLYGTFVYLTIVHFDDVDRGLILRSILMFFGRFRGRFVR